MALLRASMSFATPEADRAARRAPPVPWRPLLAGFSAFILTAPFADAHPLAGHHLLITSTRTGDAEIFLAIPAHGDLLNLSRSPGSDESRPAWSPDGKHIVFVSNRVGSTNLWIMDADGGRQRRLPHTLGVSSSPSWQATPDGDRIVFGYRGAAPKIASIRPDGSDLRFLGSGLDPVLSPDGQRICFTAPATKVGETVHLMNWDGSERRRLIHASDPVSATFPTWSPDGASIVYSSPVGLFVVDVHGSQPRCLTRFGIESVSILSSWSPDGAWIAFSLTDHDGGSTTTTPTELDAARRPATQTTWIVRPDGSQVQSIESLRRQRAIDGNRPAWKPLIRFPDQGALPVEFPALETSCDVEQLPEGVLRLREPRRSRDQVRALAALIPGGTFDVTPDRWQPLPQTHRRLVEGPSLHVLLLGDSIINDTGRSGWIHALRERHPETEIRVTTITRGSTGCAFYREDNRIARFVAPLSPDLVVIGGISHGNDIQAVREVIQQIRRTGHAEVLLLTGAYGQTEPLRSERTSSSEFASDDFNRRLELLAAELGCAFCDMEALWATYVRQSGQPTNWFKRDAIHPNERGEAVLARILEAWFATP